MANRGPKPVAAVLRFERFYVPEPNSGCWLWIGHLNGKYGGFGTNGTVKELAHRFSYKAFVGHIPDDLTVDHKCNNTLCVNPEHLQLLTRGDNTRKYLATITHCPRGHSYDLENTRYAKTGKRDCRTCDREYQWNKRHGLLPVCEEVTP